MSTVRLRIGPADHGRRMSLDEFIEAEEEPGYRYELARGVLEVTEIPGDDHWQMLDTLHEAVRRYRREHPGVIVRIGHGSEARYVIPEIGSGRHPDVAIVVQGDPRDDNGRLRPSMAVEVVAPGSRARQRDDEGKKADSLRLDIIREDWIVDPAERRVTVLIQRGAGPDADWDERVFRDEEVIESARLPNLGIAVETLGTGIEGPT